ncbi:putative ribose/xylose/arabinose/galactoside ABC-type transport system permease component [Klebsiella pneumoniae]|uniref:Putative ribose/xylose/arabinose/galactoside ABC-type transport system permease component n=1 Tax=Klebsiella pneumoniae TaxID=573 RepID=A0A3S4H258_KLEPN|nr:putative ribose/xylose/arabinose/galactoside ABC-type transport system permease component [Klebsiella pneumoniae]
MGRRDPHAALLGILILLIGHIVLNHMRFGRYVTAIGANAEGARRSGINTKAVTMKVYIISGMAAALGGDDHYRTPRQRLLQPGRRL